MPKYVRQDVAPPSPEDVTRFLEAAWKRDPDFGMLLWLAMITGGALGRAVRPPLVDPFLDDRCMIVARTVVNRGRIAARRTPRRTTRSGTSPITSASTG